MGLLNKKTVDDINAKGKKVLVRCDFNVPLKDGVITDEKQFDIPIDSEEEKINERLTLDKCINELSEKDRKLIELRYFMSKTQTEVVGKLGMSQVQVSRKEKKILLKMRKKLLC